MSIQDKQKQMQVEIDRLNNELRGAQQELSGFLLVSLGFFMRHIYLSKACQPVLKTRGKCFLRNAGYESKIDKIY